ncbi:uncharacterized protein LOC142979514 [Anticarsia gemmatalis]|uniref:uncharacterized protein LOC142979514 n=1 Tax=Anticarsia gemmatalis TaxID=129554 RepID=UPI003F76F56C
MSNLLLCCVVLYTVTVAMCDVCNIQCPQGDKMACAFDAENKTYKMFSSKCAMIAYGECHNIGFFEQDIDFCIKSQLNNLRRFYGDSCPVFCPNHYRPVCGASKLRFYKYRTFNNGCYLDMLNCRGDEDNGYVEVGLEFCQRHAMKNIFKETVVFSGFHDYKDYHDY